MNPLIKKEIRLLLPAWIAAMALAVVPAGIWHLCWVASDRDDWLFLNYALSHYVPLLVAFGILCLGITSFGQEFSSNTFSVLLSQPEERRRLWTAKSKVLALAFGTVWSAAFVSISWQFDSLYAKLPYFVSPVETLAFLTVSALAVCSGGLWTTLLLRQTAGAFWITLLTPVAIDGAVGTVLGFFPIPDSAISAITMAALFCYSIAGFFWARRLFFRAQDTQWTGGDVLFPWRGKSLEQSGSLVKLPRNRFLALVWKEIRLHEITLFIGVILLAMHLAALVLHPFVTNRNTKMVLELIWSLWLLMPLLLGCGAVAEERKLGIMESQLCLPVFRRYQFMVKFFTAFTLSMVLGAVMPTVIERSTDFGTHWFDYWIFAAAAGIFLFSFYASTLTRSTLHAMGAAFAIPAIAGVGVMGFCLLAFNVGPFASAVQPQNNDRFCLLMVICLLVFPLLLIRLMFWNFKWFHPSGKMFRFNIFTMLISFGLVFVLTSLIFFRPWELLSPIESPRGPARLSAEAPVRLSFARGRELVGLLPDGRLWNETTYYRPYRFLSLQWERWLPNDSHRLPFFNGTNWDEIAPGQIYNLGLQRNGTLWSMFQYGRRANRAQVGSDTDWRKAASNDNGFLLLKQDGTLWLWGTNAYANASDASVSKKFKMDLATPPVRIDAGTNWVNLIRLPFYITLLQKSDGTFWRWQAGNHDVFGLVAETNLDGQWSSYARWWQYATEVKTNGELWLFKHPVGQWDYYENIPVYSEKIQLGSEPVWKAACFVEYGSLILLRQDGTLWKWNFLDNKSFHPVQLGHHSDWVGLAGDNWNSIALASDGSLWSWNDASDHFWLAPSRKPVYMGNVLSGSR